jgi:hypothetical protein
MVMVWVGQISGMVFGVGKVSGSDAHELLPILPNESDYLYFRRAK